MSTNENQGSRTQFIAKEPSGSFEITEENDSKKFGQSIKPQEI